MLTFNAIDVETANDDRASICQVGVVAVVEGRIGSRWGTLVDPGVPFAPMNVQLHGIRQVDVKGKPTLAEIWMDLSGRLGDSYTVSHTVFDQQAFERAADRYGLPGLGATWIDSRKVAKIAWPTLGTWALKPVAHHLGIRFRHHDAVEDARAVAEVVIRASRETGIDMEGWWARLGTSGDPEIMGNRVRRHVNPNGVLRGQEVVFTGTLKTTRRVAEDLAADAGMRVAEVVTRSTTMLVVGSLASRQSVERQRALDLIRAGVSIEVVPESEFRCLVS